MASVALLAHWPTDAPCPTCHVPLSRTAVFVRDQLKRPPQAGDLTVCVKCASFLRFTLDMQLQALLHTEFAKLDSVTRHMMAQARYALVLAGRIPRNRPKPSLDNCKRCHGAHAGVPGNENRLEGGAIVCDYCHALDLARTVTS